MTERKIIPFERVPDEKESPKEKPAPSGELMEMTALLQRINRMKKYLRTASYNEGRYFEEKKKLADMPHEKIAELLVEFEESGWHLRPAYLSALVDTFNADEMAEQMRLKLKEEHDVPLNPLSPEPDGK
jgi:hypothetical protein